MRELNAQVVRPKLSKTLAILKLQGFINAATLMEFEGVLDEILLESRKDVVIDCQGLEYVNSAGIGALLNYQQSFQSRGGDLVLMRAPRGVAVVLRNLGVTGTLLLLKDEQEALAYLERDAKGARTWKEPAAFLRSRHPVPKEDADAKTRVLLPVHRPAGRASGSVLIVEPGPQDFAEVLRFRYNGRKGRVVQVADCLEALSQLDRVSPDLIILRDSAPNAEEFLSKVKSQRGRSLTSVIRIYGSGTIPPPSDFRIRENDAFIEPFEVGELFALADLELRRVPRSRSEMLHMTTFEFATTPANAERAGRLAASLVASSGLAEDAAAGFLAAVKEAVDNAGRHAHAGSAAKKCTVTFLLDPEKAAFVIRDQGPGFDHAYFTSKLTDETAYVKARRAKEEGRHGGLDILLMHKNCDRLAFEGSGNVVRLEKRL